MNSYVINYILTGMKGGMNRVEIIRLLSKNSLNANQLKEKTGLDYKTVQHHIRVLSKNRFIFNSGKKYGAIYSLTEEFKENFNLFKEILAKVNKLPERK